MKLVYSAEHIFRFTIDQPVAVRNIEVDHIRIELMWVDADDEGPEGWFVTGSLRGWPLTAKGKRDKRIKEREGVHVNQYPAALQPAVWEAWDAAVERSGIDTDLIVNPDRGLFDEKNWPPAPRDVSGGTCSYCGTDVIYDNDGPWPFRGVDGTTTCPESLDRGSRWGHRLDRNLADEIFATYQRRTGEKARHAI